MQTLTHNYNLRSVANKRKIGELFKESGIKDNTLNRFKVHMGRHKRTKDDRVLQFDERFSEYLRDIEKCTGKDIPREQKRLIKKAVQEGRYVRLSKEESKAHRKQYTKKRKELITEWEKNTGREWDKYTEPVYSKNGKIVRNVGDTFDMHHCILCSWGGDNSWWNFVPAKFPSVHQEKIHRKGGICDKIFG
jgi:hypothetical protein